jgi:L-fuconolactonase
VIIDAHHHLWRFDPAQYDWIAPSDTALRHDFLLSELDAVLAAAGVDGSVVVQARQTLDETLWLLGLARRSPRIRGVVGWVPLTDPDLPDILATLTADRHLVAVRHVVQGESDPAFLLRPTISRGIASLAGAGLAYDLLVREHQLAQAAACVDAHPDVRFVLDHAAKPGPGDLGSWSAGIRDLARRPNVWCKISGLALEAGPGWSVAGLRRAVDVLFAAFGAQRLLYGSDWPVCLLATGYGRWLEAVRELIAACTAAEQAAILGGNAVTAYRLEDPCE